MGLLDGVLGGIVGAEMASVVNGLIQKHGGVQGIVNQFEAQGLGNTVRSWVSTGPNQPVSPEQVQAALGPDAMAQLATELGITREELSTKLAKVMPTAIDKLTPDGVVPKGS